MHSGNLYGIVYFMSSMSYLLSDENVVDIIDHRSIIGIVINTRCHGALSIHFQFNVLEAIISSIEDKTLSFLA